ncbi:MAG: hypothetical protein JWP85_1555 [Rhodoglobus sp.]|nr:hypothetical protein [Rhodoglobus sp.]
MQEASTQILIVGGGLGGVAAALSAADRGMTVILTEETDWLGGQLTTQGVPFDEHPWIEETGCSLSYRRLRDGIRDYYRNHYPLRAESRADRRLNPGMGFVSRLCSEPRVGVRVIDELIAAHVASGRIRVLYFHVPVAVTVDANSVGSVTVEDVHSNEQTVITAHYVLDATELGDLLELGGIDHVTGAESREHTGEPHALEGAPDPLEQQAITWCFAIDWSPNTDNVIEKPRDYEFWRSYRADFWPGPQLGFEVSDAITAKPLTRNLLAGPREARTINDLWHFRRLLYKEHFSEGAFSSDIVLMNWTGLDYWLKPLVGVTRQERHVALDEARQLSLSILYWMQTEAPRFGGGQGYPEVRLRADVMGTADGLAKVPYYREGRRLKAEFTILEQHIGVQARNGVGYSEPFVDTVGVGSYRIDLHPSTAPRNYIDVESYPFQIPLGALLPIRVQNLLAACKNIGTTHITNGAYRLHPVEWGIGEAAGSLAAYCLVNGVSPTSVRNEPELLADFQRTLVDAGVQLEWPTFGALGPDKRFGSPSAIHGGSWVKEAADGTLEAGAADEGR